MMGNRAFLPENDPDLRGGGPPALRRQMGFPRLHGRRFSAGVFVSFWGVAGILSTIAPDIRANSDHVMFYYILLMTGILLVLLSVAAANLPAAERLAARLEGMLRDML